MTTAASACPDRARAWASPSSPKLARRSIGSYRGCCRAAVQRRQQSRQQRGLALLPLWTGARRRCSRSTDRRARLVPRGRRAARQGTAGRRLLAHRRSDEVAGRAADRRQHLLRAPVPREGDGAELGRRAHRTGELVGCRRRAGRRVVARVGSFEARGLDQRLLTARVGGLRRARSGCARCAHRQGRVPRRRRGRAHARAGPVAAGGGRALRLPARVHARRRARRPSARARAQPTRRRSRPVSSRR